MVIIIATSCAGNRTLLRGESRSSIPSASATGAVVAVSNPAAETSKNIRKARKNPEPQPSGVDLQKTPLEDNASLPREEDLERHRERHDKEHGRRRRKNVRTGMRLAATSATSAAATKRSPVVESMRNSPTASAAVATILALGSSDVHR